MHNRRSLIRSRILIATAVAALLVSPLLHAQNRVTDSDRDGAGPHRIRDYTHSGAGTLLP